MASKVGKISRVAADWTDSLLILLSLSCDLFWFWNTSNYSCSHFYYQKLPLLRSALISCLWLYICFVLGFFWPVIHIFFFIFFSVMVYHRTLNAVHWALQEDLAVYLLIPNSQILPPPSPWWPQVCALCLCILFLFCRYVDFLSFWLHM